MRNEKWETKKNENLHDYKRQKRRNDKSNKED